MAEWVLQVVFRLILVCTLCSTAVFAQAESYGQSFEETPPVIADKFLYAQVIAAIENNDAQLESLIFNLFPKASWYTEFDNNVLMIIDLSTVIRKSNNYAALLVIYEYISGLFIDNDRVMLFNISYWMVADFMYFSQYEKAFELFFPFLSMMESWERTTINDREILASMWFVYGQVLLRKSNSQGALSALFNAEKIYLNLKEGHPDLYRVHAIIGETYLKVEDYQQAEFYVLKGIKNFPDERQDARGYLAALLAESYLGLKKFELANSVMVDYFKNPVDQRPDFKLYIMDVYVQVLQSLDKIDEAITTAKLALELAQTYGNLDIINTAKHRLGYLLALNGDEALGERLIREAIDTHHQNLAISSPTPYLNLVNLLTKQNRYQDALVVYQQYKEASDKHRENINQLRIKDLELTRNFQKIEKEKEKLITLQEKQRLELDLTKQNEKNTKTFLIILIAAVCLLIVVVLIIGNLLRVIKKSNGKLEMLSFEDPLTGLKNRRFVHAFMEKEAPRLIRSKEQLVVILIDIDYFKKINDTYGHHIGDQVLLELGLFFKQHTRSDDVVARWGGEEFLLLCRSHGVNADQSICFQLQQQLALTKFTTKNLTITISMGANHFPLKTILDNDIVLNDANAWQIHWQESLTKADHALYKVKSSGRDNWILN